MRYKVFMFTKILLIAANLCNTTHEIPGHMPASSSESTGIHNRHIDAVTKALMDRYPGLKMRMVDVCPDECRIIFDPESPGTYCNFNLTISESDYDKLRVYFQLIQQVYEPANSITVYEADRLLGGRINQYYQLRLLVQLRVARPDLFRHLSDEEIIEACVNDAYLGNVKIPNTVLDYAGTRESTLMLFFHKNANPMEIHEAQRALLCDFFSYMQTNTPAVFKDLLHQILSQNTSFHDLRTLKAAGSASKTFSSVDMLRPSSDLDLSSKLLSK